MAIKRKVKKETVKSSSTLSEYMSNTDKKVIKRYNENSNPSLSWWKYEPDRMWMGVESAVSVMETSQVTRRMLNIKFSRLYSNMEAIGFPYSNLMKSSPDNSTNNRITLNIIQSVIDAVSSKIAKDQPRLSFSNNR